MEKVKASHIPKRKRSSQPKKLTEADFNEDIPIKKLMLGGITKTKRPNIPLFSKQPTTSLRDVDP